MCIMHLKAMDIAKTTLGVTGCQCRKTKIVFRQTIYQCGSIDDVGFYRRAYLSGLQIFNLRRTAERRMVYSSVLEIDIEFLAFAVQCERRGAW